MQLPLGFTEEMKALLGEEADAFFRSYEKAPCAGVRLNLRKSPSLPPDFPGWDRKVPWTEAGFYTNPEAGFGNSLLHAAGALYIQEPSAMAPAEFLPVKPGDRVLDLCAAPGGKSTRLFERLQGKGVLFANDISASRAQALLRNLERFGAGNLFVTAEAPEKLAEAFPESFDAILVDAPCSGEGMFRKEPSLIRSFEERGPEYYAPLQKDILREAVRMLKPGGYLLYSTCTFSLREDEEVVETILKERTELSEVDLRQHPLFSASFAVCNRGIKFFPHRLSGEGHFLALLRREGEKPVSAFSAASAVLSDSEGSEGALLRRAGGEGDPQAKGGTEVWEMNEQNGQKGQKGRKPGKGMSRKNRKPETDRLSGSFTNPEEAFWNRYLSALGPFPAERIMEKNGRVYLLPEGEKPVPSLRYLRTGLLLGERKKDRFVPAQALAMALLPEEFSSVCRFSQEDPVLLRYLKGETIQTEGAQITGEEGICLICGGNLPLGFARRKGNMLKNDLDPGYRIS